MTVLGQRQARVRFDWGPVGAAHVVEGAEVAVVVDVLSFTTTTCVALERGATVLPYRWRDETAATYAVSQDAELAVGRSAASTGQASLSPAGMRSATARRVVLPSPNGSTISWLLASSGAAVVAGCLRNARAVAEWVLAREGAVAVVAAGERWPDDSLRPAVEDLVGAGAVIQPLLDAGWDLSPEAVSAAAAFRAVRDVRDTLRWSASGLELVSRGFEEDVDLAAELDATTVVPLLHDHEFRSAQGVGFPG